MIQLKMSGMFFWGHSVDLLPQMILNDLEPPKRGF